MNTARRQDKMLLLSIMDADLEHLEEICLDIKRQYDEGISNCAMFYVKLVPEGKPAIDKASIFAERYIPFRDRLAEMGLTCGVLVQCTIGHGNSANDLIPFTKYENLTDGKVKDVVCPYDEDARAYFKDQMAKIGALCPSTIMVDGDFRLMCRPGKGCACPLHMAAFERMSGAKITRKDLYAILKDRKHPKHREYTDIFVETQRESLVGAMKAMREGLDSVDPKLHAVNCNGGSPANEFSDEFAKIMAGEGNPSAVRVGNGNYTHVGPRHLSSVAYRFAQAGQLLLRDGVDMILEEGDTCPHNRYSTSAQALHTHHIVTILEHASGTKHWITRLNTYEPRSGEAYRKKLGANAKMYDALYEMVPHIKRCGCRIPLPTQKDYCLYKEGYPVLHDGWSDCVLERFGVPLYYSMDAGGATFLEGDSYIFTDEEILDMLKGPLFIASDAAQELCERGFGEYLGVSIREWTGDRPSFERIGPERIKCNPQQKFKELKPVADNVRADSMVYHLKDGTDEIAQFPGVTVYKNALGGMAVCFCGTPNTPFSYKEAFSFLTETRKKQIVRLLDEAGCLPVCVPGDEEVYVVAGETDENELFVALFNISLDPVEEIEMYVEKKVSSVRMLTPDGEWKSLAYTGEGKNIRIQHPLYTHEPVVLLLGR